VGALHAVSHVPFAVHIFLSASQQQGKLGTSSSRQQVGKQASFLACLVCWQAIVVAKSHALFMKSCNTIASDCLPKLYVKLQGILDPTFHHTLLPTMPTWTT
jgi:hypothetical protein